MKEFNDPKLKIWWRRGVEYKLEKLNMETRVGKFIHNSYSKNVNDKGEPIKCTFNAKFGYILNTSYSCPKCDKTDVKNTYPLIKDILDKLVDKNNGKLSYSIKKFEDNIVYTIIKGNNEINLFYMDKRYYTNIIKRHAYHEMFIGRASREFNNVKYISHLDHDNLTKAIIKVIKDGL